MRQQLDGSLNWSKLWCRWYDVLYDLRWLPFIQTLVKEPVNDSLYENYQDYLSGTWTELPPIITTAPPALITRSSLLNATAASINAALLAPLLAPPATTAFSTTQPADSTSNATMSKGADAGANLLQTVAAKSSVSSDEGTTTSTATEEVPDDEEVPDTGGRYCSVCACFAQCLHHLQRLAASYCTQVGLTDG